MVKLRIRIALGLALTTSIFVLGAMTKPSGAYSVKLGRLKYSGGGDWYSSKTALGNLAKFCNSKLGMSIDPVESVVDVGGPDLYNHPYIFMTGHGNVLFSDVDARNLRKYLESGGFLHICDNYGMDKFVRSQMKKVFPEIEFKELPHRHPIYSAPYVFASGLPKIHQHDGKSPQGFGLIYKGRLVCFYDYECDLGNGWEDAEVHNDPEPIRQKALQMGANILRYAFDN
ncbi:MAG: DUF4159 domain-containing protein [Sphingomonadales bacterium]|jgi:hypothetical protein